MKVKMYIRMDEINYRNMFSVIIYSIQIVIFIIWSFHVAYIDNTHIIRK